MLSKIMFSRMVKSCKFIVKTMVFEGLTGCVREQKMYQHSIQMDTKIHAKLMKNRSRRYVRKSNANNSENHSTQSAIKHKTLPKHINKSTLKNTRKRKRKRAPRVVPRFQKPAGPGVVARGTAGMLLY